MTNEFRKNAEGYIDPTASATLDKPEPGDVWEYMSCECLIIKNHGSFSTILMLGAEKRNDGDLTIATGSGERYTNPKKLTWGAHHKMRGYIGSICRSDLNHVIAAIEAALGVELPCKTNAQPLEMRALDELEREVQKIVHERDGLLKERDWLKGQLAEMTELHRKAVEQVNKVTFAKLKVVNQLELLQGMVGSVLAHFQIDTED